MDDYLLGTELSKGAIIDSFADDQGRGFLEQTNGAITV
jgi:hypothetical protein